MDEQSGETEEEEVMGVFFCPCFDNVRTDIRPACKIQLRKYLKVWTMETSRDH